jgi:hypothetical protein
MLSKVVRRVPHVFVGYLFLLLGFVSLGLFVAALAFGSELAVAAGVALVGSLVAAVAGFRTGAASLAKSRKGEPEHNASIWAIPLRQGQIDQYNVNFRDAPDLPAAPHPVRPTEQRRHRRPVGVYAARSSADVHC